MADDRTIRIEITAGLKNSSGTNSGDDSDDNDSVSKRAIHPTKGLLKELMSKHKFAVYSIEQTVSSVTNAAKGEINRYFTLREDYLSQRTLENQKIALGKVTGGIKAVVSGASAGGAIGAVASGVFWGVGEFLGMRSAGSNYYQQLNSANFQTSFSQVRAGLIDNGRGTEN